MKIKTRWKRYDLLQSNRIRRKNNTTGQWYYKTQNRVSIREGDSIIIQMRLENFYFHFIKKHKKRIGDFIIAKYKIESDEIKYCYIYITHKTKMIVRKLWIKDFKLIRTEKEKLSNRTIEHGWYNFTFYKDEHRQLDTINGIMTDINYSFSKEIERDCKKLSNREFKDRIKSAVFSKWIGRDSESKRKTGLSKRRKVNESTFNKNALRTIKENMISHYSLGPTKFRYKKYSQKKIT